MLLCHVHILLGEICWYLLSTFQLDCFIIVEFQEFFMYSREGSLVRCVVHKYFPPVALQEGLSAEPKLSFWENENWLFLSKMIFFLLWVSHLASRLRIPHPAPGPSCYYVLWTFCMLKSMLQSTFNLRSWDLVPVPFLFRSMDLQLLQHHTWEASCPLLDCFCTSAHIGWA